jgi:hypothetical protein
MKRDDIFPSKYLKAADVVRPIVFTIERAELETLKNPEGREHEKMVLYFRETEKALPLNVTNWDAVAEICGADSDDWPGGRVELYATKTQMGGRTVDCIRIRPPRAAKGAAKATKPQPRHDEPKANDMDDEIPF